MQEPTFERYEEPAEVAPSRLSRVRGMVSTAVGAVVALSLLLALGVWFYRLGVRDAQNVPIIRASADPAKVRPEDPGGTNAPHQDVKSYEIAEAEQPSAVAALVAPEPAKPTREDVAMRDLQGENANEVDQLVGQVIGEQAQEANTDDTTASLAAKPTQPTQQPSAVQPIQRAQPTAPKPAVEVPSQQPVDPDEQVGVATLGADDTQPTTLQPVQPATPADTVEEQPEQPEQPVVTGGTEYAPAASPTAPARPSNLAARVETAAAEARQDETDLVTAAANSSIQIQLAADPSEGAIRSRWQRVFNANKDLLRDKALAVQSTLSGGTTFYRLRVGPFNSRSEAIALCQALKARGQDCIVTRNS